MKPAIPEYILFDLDGTLTNPFEGITNAVAYALEGMQRPVPPPQALAHFIGPPLEDSFATIFNSDAEVQRAIVLFREYYAVHGIHQNKLINGVPELLAQLQQQGKKICLATSKPIEFAQHILNAFHLAQYFTCIEGGRPHAGGGLKQAVVQSVLDACQIKPGQALLVGDTRHDVLGAKICGVPCIGILTGFGTRQDLEQAGAIAIAENYNELGHLLLQ